MPHKDWPFCFSIRLLLLQISLYSWNSFDFSCTLKSNFRLLFEFTRHLSEYAWMEAARGAAIVAGITFDSLGCTDFTTLLAKRDEVLKWDVIHRKHRIDFAWEKRYSRNQGNSNRGNKHRHHLQNCPCPQRHPWRQGRDRCTTSHRYQPPNRRNHVWRIHLRRH